MTKRKTCEHAADSEAKYSWCLWEVTTPASVTITKWAVDDRNCEGCPCWKEKGTAVEAQCAFCGETKPFPAALMPIQPKPRVCAGCAEKGTTDAE